MPTNKGKLLISLNKQFIYSNWLGADTKTILNSFTHISQMTLCKSTCVMATISKYLCLLNFINLYILICNN